MHSTKTIASITDNILLDFIIFFSLFIIADFFRKANQITGINLLCF